MFNAVMFHSFPIPCFSILSPTGVQAYVIDREEALLVRVLTVIFTLLSSSIFVFVFLVVSNIDY
jgi:hypothetical protein